MNIFFCNCCSPTCPLCNANGEAHGRVYLNVDQEDTEAYLRRNPAIFAELVDRHQNIIQQGNQIRAIQAQNAQNINILQPIPFHVNDNMNEYDGDASDDSDDGDASDDGDDGAEVEEDDTDSEYFEISHLRLNMQVNRTGIFFTPLHVEDATNSDSDSGPDVLQIPHMGVQMEVDYEAIHIALLENHEDND